MVPGLSSDKGCPGSLDGETLLAITYMTPSLQGTFTTTPRFADPSSKSREILAKGGNHEPPFAHPGPAYSVSIKGRIPPIMSRLPPGVLKIPWMNSGIPAGRGSMPKRGPRIVPRLWVKSVSIEISFVYALDEPSVRPIDGLKQAFKAFLPHRLLMPIQEAAPHIGGMESTAYMGKATLRQSSRAGLSPGTALPPWGPS